MNAKMPSCLFLGALYLHQTCACQHITRFDKIKIVYEMASCSLVTFQTQLKSCCRFYLFRWKPKLPNDHFEFIVFSAKFLDFLDPLTHFVSRVSNMKRKALKKRIVYWVYWLKIHGFAVYRLIWIFFYYYSYCSWHV